MGTEILRPQDCLIKRIGVPPVSRRRSYYGYPAAVPNQNYVFNPRSRKPAATRPEPPRRIQAQPAAAVSKRSSSDDLRGFKMEKVTILRRGESLGSNMAAMTKQSNDGTRPGPEIAPKQVRKADLRSPASGKTDVYAGSAFAVSPEPSSLPLPSFSRRKQASRIAAVDGDSATRDLRRLLRLD